jgi:hypothetical protein
MGTGTLKFFSLESCDFMLLHDPLGVARSQKELGGLPSKSSR